VNPTRKDRYRDLDKLRAKRERQNLARRGQPSDPMRASCMNFWNVVRVAILKLEPIAPGYARGKRILKTERPKTGLP
jgi:hypothetical protein